MQHRIQPRCGHGTTRAPDLMTRRYGSGIRTRPDQLAPSTPPAQFLPSPGRHSVAPRKGEWADLWRSHSQVSFFHFPSGETGKSIRWLPRGRSGEGWRPGVCRFFFFPADAKTPSRQGVTQQAWRQGVRSGGDSPPPCHRTAHPGAQVPGANATPRSRPRIVAESPRSPSKQRGRVPTVRRWPFPGGGGQP